MNFIRIVCAHDGLARAHDVQRLLSAEEHAVEITYGRNSLDRLESTRTGNETVVLIWSADAPLTHYMFEWLNIDAARLIEIAVAPGWPSNTGRRSPVIDFCSWNGTRGSAPWRALTERLRLIARGPAKPAPIVPALVLVGASAMAAGAALFVRVQAPEPTPVATETAPSIQIAQVQADFEGVGGAMRLEEPASYIDEPEVRFGPYARARQLDPLSRDALLEAELARPMRFRETGLIQRIADAVRTVPLGGDRDTDRN